MANKIAAILLSGGTGSRIGNVIPKQFISLGGKQIILHALETMHEVDRIEKIIIPTHPDWCEATKELLTTWGFVDQVVCIEGGATRQESVYRGLQVLESSQCSSVIIHEAVRPFVTTADFIALIACNEPNCIYGTSIPFTVLIGEEYVQDSLERKDLINVQLPHKYDYQLLYKAHKKMRDDNKTFTEDASLLISYNTDVNIKVLSGSIENFKITYPIDLITAEAILDLRTGRTT